MHHLHLILTARSDLATSPRTHSLSLWERVGRPSGRLAAADPSPGFATLFRGERETRGPFGKLVARGQRRPASPGLNAALCQAFGLPPDGPLAPITLAADGIDPGPDYWLRADPVHLRIHIDKVVLDPAPLRLEPAEAEALVASLNAHFAEDGLHFCAPAPERGYLRVPHPLRLHTRSPDAVSGQAIDAHLPQGEDARLWRARMNEIQMLLHDHPVNAAREARGLAPVNGLWLWGGGVATPLPRPSFDAIYANTHEARALAQAAGLPCTPPPRPLAELPSGLDRVLVVLDAPDTQPPPADARDGFAALLTALKWGHLKRLTLETPDEKVELGTADAWKVWRRR